MKKLIQTLSICAISFTLLPENSSGGEREKREDKPRAERPERGKGRDFFKSLDKDNDRAISKEEAGERWARLGKLDKDGDGKVTVKEMMAGRPDGAPGRGDGKGGKKGGRPQPGEMFKRADKNEDGKISKDEVPDEAWARLGRLDKNEDGSVSKKEFEAGMAAMRKKGGRDSGGEDKFKKADKNGDGKLTEDEVPAEFWARIGKFDKNGDKGISKEEIAAGFKASGGGPGRDGRGGPPGGPDAIFAKMDENKDGKLSKDEVPPEMWNRLSNADEDADGTVSKGELEKVFKKRAAYTGGDKPKKRPEGKKKQG